MSVVKFSTFGGMLPAVDDRLLPENAAAYARDCFLYSGRLTGWRMPKLLDNLLSATTRSAYRVPADATKTRITDDSYWLEFADKDTTVVRTPVIDDTFKRYYFASPSVRPKYNTFDRIAAAQTAWFLGVPAPTEAPSVSPSGGNTTASQAARTYVYTYVTAYGEESAPSPPLVQNGYLNDTWVVTVTSPAANDMGVDRNITDINIYRTVVADSGVASYFLVDTIAVSGTTYNDGLSDETIAENVELPSTDWTPPPDDLEGIVLGANGMIAGWRENEVWFAEPFRPHTFPSIYTVTTEFPIVGIGVIGQAFVVITEGYPVVLTGVNPASISAQVVRKAEPCTSRGSIVSAPDVVYYTSPNGLQAVTAYGSITNTTEAWITRDKWNQLVPLISGRACINGPAYFSFGSIYTDLDVGGDNATEAQSGFSITSPQTSSQEVSTPTGGQVSEPAFSLLTAPNALDIVNVMVDMWTAVPLLIQDQKVYYYDFADTAPEIMPFLWRSRIIQETNRKNYAAMRIWYTVPDTTPAQNVDRNVDAIQDLAADQYGIVRVYADGDLWTTREIRNSGELLRILSGLKAEFWFWEFEARIEILNAQVATAVEELAGV